ncbi:GAF domain-containing sensor histidine kinase [Mucilaginibacter sp. SMC90]|uniref:GAF domain-containing sensor histidine kinase n=1 Tax=Mucilaginibacter sp. SMC90 TaxID=2929803 RepID=UPI001FB2577C|nr:GAF domain-containing sensor histidine kinase [Mucilaginibacter sp. SMC90]UOE49516.1 GAF domain-containing sensor histidine kinase [Mucilaginibacter sp. SMC90]
MPVPPIPDNEMERLLSLSEFDLDYTEHQDSFKDLAKLAAKVTGTEISLVNLIDSYTQWSISGHGLEIEQMPREDSVCQYTIINGEYFEVGDLQNDERFKDKFYVTDEPRLRYYYGIPLKTTDNHNIGALCVLDKNVKELTPEKVELLKIIASEIVNRLKDLKVIGKLKNKLSEANETQKKVAHDIRGPLSGIIGLAQLISDQGEANQIEEVLEFINLIHKSGRSILELADEILSADKKEHKPVSNGSEFNLLVLKDKIERLFVPQARNKNILLTVNTSSESERIPFARNKLLQITGNLISNAIKFTPGGGYVVVNLSLEVTDHISTLQIQVKDSGVGIDKEGIEKILKGNSASTNGTTGEAGFGFGLALVKHLIESLKGSINIYSKPNEGTVFEVKLPQKVV